MQGRYYVRLVASCRINNSYLRGMGINETNEGLGERPNIYIYYARQHRHGAVGHRADEVNREALVETAPALKVDDLPRGADDARSLARRARGEQELALRLQARPHHLVRIRRHRCCHLCHRGAKKNGKGRLRPVGAMPFCLVRKDLVLTAR